MAGTAPRRDCLICSKRFRAPVASPDEDHCTEHRGVVVALTPPPAPAPPVEPTGPGPIETSVRTRLDGVDRTSTPLGAAVLKLAAEMDAAKGVAAARISTELTKLLDRALDGVPQAADRADDLERLRRARRGA